MKYVPGTIVAVTLLLGPIIATLEGLLTLTLSLTLTLTLTLALTLTLKALLSVPTRCPARGPWPARRSPSQPARS